MRDKERGIRRCTVTCSADKYTPNSVLSSTAVLIIFGFIQPYDEDMTRLKSCYLNDNPNILYTNFNETDQVVQTRKKYSENHFTTGDTRVLSRNS